MATSSELEHLRRLNGEIEWLFVEGIKVLADRRPLNADIIQSLAESMDKIGLMTPITIRGDVENGSVAELVAGAHRLAAARKLGWDKIPCFVIYDRADAEMWEISENLHRAELTALQKAEQVKRWISLWEKKMAQVAPLSLGRGKKGGNRETARQLSMDRREVERSTKIGGLSDQAKKAAVRAGLDDNQSALLKAASKAKPAEQVEAIETWGKKEGDVSGIWRSHLRELIDKIDTHLARAPSPVDHAYGLKRLDGKWPVQPAYDSETGEIFDEIAVEGTASPQRGEGAESSTPPISDPAPIAPAEDAAAASACGEGTPAASSIPSDPWAELDIPPMLDRRGRA